MNNINKKIDSEKFYDINKFPKTEGILLFPISMSRISNSQSANDCFLLIKELLPKITQPTVGLNFIYSDSLYFNSDESAFVLKNKLENLAHAHKFSFERLLEKNITLIPSAFNYLTWSQFKLEIKSYYQYFGAIKKIYDSDRKFSECVDYDVNQINTKNSKECNINFILEEILLFYLVSKGLAVIKNDYIRNNPKWLLWCYPGDPLVSEAYLFKNNLLNLSETDNKYENSFYNLSNKKLYDLKNI